MTKEEKERAIQFIAVKSLDWIEFEYKGHKVQINDRVLSLWIDGEQVEPWDFVDVATKAAKQLIDAKSKPTPG